MRHRHCLKRCAKWNAPWVGQQGQYASTFLVIFSFQVPCMTCGVIDVARVHIATLSIEKNSVGESYAASLKYEDLDCLLRTNRNPCRPFSTVPILTHPKNHTKKSLGSWTFFPNKTAPPPTFPRQSTALGGFSPWALPPPGVLQGARALCALAVWATDEMLGMCLCVICRDPSTFGVLSSFAGF